MNTVLAHITCQLGRKPGLAIAILCLAGPVTGMCSPDDNASKQQAVSIKSVVQMALKNSPEIKSAEQMAISARAETRATASVRRFQVTASSYLSDGDSTAILSASSMVPSAASSLVPGGGFADQNLTIMTPLFTGGRLEALQRSAQKRAEAAAFDVDEVRLDVGLRVQEACYRSLMARAESDTARSRILVDQEMLNTAEALLESGKGLRASVLRAEAELEDARRMLTGSINAEARALLDVRLTAGVSADSPLTIVDSTISPGALPEVTRLVQGALSRRPDAMASEARRKAAEEQTKAVQADRAPQIYGTAMADVFTATQMQRRAGYTIGIMVSLPVFDSGMRRAATDAAKAMAIKAAEEERRTRLSIETQVRQAWLDADTALKNLQAAHRQSIAAHAARDITALRLQSGKAIIVEMLDANAAVAAATSLEARSTYELRLALAGIRRACGDEPGMEGISR